MVWRNSYNGSLGCKRGNSHPYLHPACHDDIAIAERKTVVGQGLAIDECGKEGLAPWVMRMGWHRVDTAARAEGACVLARGAQPLGTLRAPLAWSDGPLSVVIGQLALEGVDVIGVESDDIVDSFGVASDGDDGALTGEVSRRSEWFIANVQECFHVREWVCGRICCLSLRMQSYYSMVKEKNI